MPLPLPLPEALLLLALHPDRGTILPSAYLAIDVGIRGAIMSELKLTGHLQARQDGQVRLSPAHKQPPHHPALRDAMDVFAQEPGTSSIHRWFEQLAKRLPGLRDAVSAVLRQRGVLRATDRQRNFLPHQVTLPAADPSVREELIAHLRAALDAGEEIAPRQGMLLGLAVACRLDEPVFSELSGVAQQRAAWVAERDLIVRTTQRMVVQAEA